MHEIIRRETLLLRLRDFNQFQQADAVLQKTVQCDLLFVVIPGQLVHHLLIRNQRVTTQV